MEHTLSYDIIIIGGGGAGLRAAIAAAEKHPHLRIAIISKVYPTRSHTVSAEGGVAAAIREYDNPDLHAKDTVKGSDYLADQDAVEYFTKSSPAEIMQLEEWGCPWSREDDGKIAVRAFGGMNVKRTIFAADKSGFFLLHSLFERSLLHQNIIRHDEWYVTRLITGKKGIAGVVAIHHKTGKITEIKAAAVILATGGAGRIYNFTTNSALKTGDGIWLAYEAGAALKDMEFVQFHPTAMVKTGILITEAARGEGGRLINKNNDRFLINYLPEKMELGPRDMISRAIINEINAGRGVITPHGQCVHLDIRHLGEKLINEKLPLIREVAVNYGNTDPVREPIAVRPAQHYTMGGVSTDIHCCTSLPGLFAAGETACVTIHGANRLGSNSLAECLVFGREAGISAAQYAEKHRNDASDTGSRLSDEKKKIKVLLLNAGKESQPEIRREMRETMDSCAGIFRDEEGLSRGLAKIMELQERAEDIPVSAKSTVFNYELTGLLELKGMLKLCEAVFTCALARKESRGAHFRNDYPKRDDRNFLKHHLVIKSESGMQITDQPVTVTKWKPEERKY